MSGEKTTALARIPEAGSALVARPGAVLAQILSPEERERVRNVFANTNASGTNRMYASRWEGFEAWCVRKSIAALPAHPETLVAYLTERVSTGTAVSTAKGDLTAIAYVHARAFPNASSPTAAPLVKQALRGLARLHGRPAKKKAPAAADVVLRILGAMTSKHWSVLRDRCLLLMGFATAMRRSELVSVRIEWMQATRDGWLITIPRSKGDQEGHGQLVSIVRNVEEPLLCPVTATRAWIGARAASLNGEQSPFLFPSMNSKSSTGHLSVDAFVLHLKDAMLEAGFDDDEVKNYAGHSLRRGSATQAHRDGAGLVEIQRRLRHADVSTTTGYIAEEDAREDVIGARLGRSLKRGAP